MLARAGGAGDRAWAGCCYALSCSRKMLQGQRNVSEAFLSSSFQLIHWSHLLLLARERDRWGWHGRVSADSGVSPLLSFILLQPSSPW